METRIEKLEQFVDESRTELRAIDVQLTKIETRLDAFSTSFATKADLHREINAQTWKLVTFVCGFGTALVAATYFVITHAK